MTTVNGLALLYTKQFIQTNYDPSVWESIVKSAKPEIREVLESPLLGSKSYELAVDDHMLEQFRKETSDEDLIKCAEDGARKQLVGLFGLVVKFVSYEKLMTKTQWMWNRSFNEGIVTVVKTDKGEIKADVTEFVFSDAQRMFVQYYMQALIEIAMKKNVTSTSAKKGKASTQFVFKIRDEKR